MEKTLTIDEMDYLELEFKKQKNIHSKISFFKQLLEYEIIDDDQHDTYFAISDMSGTLCDELYRIRAWSLLEEILEASTVSVLFKNKEELADLKYYFFKVLIPYYFKTGNHEQLQVIKEFIIANYSKEFDSIDELIGYFILYNDETFIKEITKKTYLEVKNNYNLLENANHTILFRNTNVCLQENYREYTLKGENFDLQALKEEISSIDPELIVTEVEFIKEYLNRDYTYQLAERKKQIIKNPKQFFILMHNFRKYAFERGISFIIATQVFENFNDFIDSKRDGQSVITSIKSERDFNMLFSGLISLVNSNFAMAFGVFWGFIYLFDFLEETRIYPPDIASKNREAILLRKKRIIGIEEGSIFWITGYIFENWKKPDSLSSEQWTTFREETEHIFNYVSEEIDQSPSQLPENFVEEVLVDARQKIARGEFAHDNEPDEFSELLEEILLGENKKIPNYTPAFSEDIKKYPELDKYSRNDKITVEYEDGKILKDVKFKKVESDLKAGKCTIIKN